MFMSSGTVPMDFIDIPSPLDLNPHVPYWFWVICILWLAWIIYVCGGSK